MRTRRLAMIVMACGACALVSCTAGEPWLADGSAVAVDSAIAITHGTPKTVEQRHGDPINRAIIGVNHIIEYPEVDLLHTGHYLLEVRSPWAEPLDFQIACKDADACAKLCTAETRVAVRLVDSEDHLVWSCGDRLAWTKDCGGRAGAWRWSGTENARFFWTSGCCPSIHSHLVGIFALPDWTFKKDRVYKLDVLVTVPQPANETLMAVPRLSYNTGAH